MDSVLRPRDIQARIRSGESPETVAAAAQTSIERVMTFASPVLAERAFVAQQALKASVRRRTGDGAPGQLGAAVAERLSGERLDAEDVEWDAWRRDDGRWTLVAEYDAASGPERAEFVYDTAGRYVTATDEHSRWLVGERVTADPGPGPDSQMHLGDDAIELVTGRRPAPPADELSPSAPAPRVTALRPAPHPVDAIVDSSEPDEITVDLTGPAETARHQPPIQPGRPARPARPARPTRPMADADWMATQASERPARAPEPDPEPAPQPTPEAEGLFEVPAPGSPDDSSATGTREETPTEEPGAEPAARPARTAKAGRSAKGRAAIPSWDEIMFGSSND